MATTKATKELHTKRLKKLADLIAKRPGRSFNMSNWATHSIKHKPSVKDNFCGTVACALGTAALDNGFRRQGLKIEWEKCFYTKEGFHCDTPQSYEATIKFDNEEGESAGGAFFGLSIYEADDLFMGFSRTKAQVVKRIRELAERRVELGDPDVYDDESAASTVEA